MDGAGFLRFQSPEKKEGRMYQWGEKKKTSGCFALGERVFRKFRGGTGHEQGGGESLRKITRSGLQLARVPKRGACFLSEPSLIAGTGKDLGFPSLNFFAKGVRAGVEQGGKTRLNDKPQCGRCNQRERSRKAQRSPGKRQTSGGNYS